jgi:hypothetical protein
MPPTIPAPPTTPAPAATPAHPGFFEVLTERRAYTTLLYLLLSLATGILAFVWTVTGISLSLGLMILVVGLPLALAFLAGTRLLAVGELHLLRLLVGAPAEVPGPVPAGTGFLDRLKALATDGRTWTSLLYFVLHLPLGLAYFSAFVTLLATGLSLLAVPVARLLHASGRIDFDLACLDAVGNHPTLAAVLCGLVGLALVPLTLHLALLLGRFQTWLARHLLVRA